MPRPPLPPPHHEPSPLVHTTHSQRGLGPRGGGDELHHNFAQDLNRLLTIYHLELTPDLNNELVLVRTGATTLGDAVNFRRLLSLKERTPT